LVDLIVLNLQMLVVNENIFLLLLMVVGVQMFGEVVLIVDEYKKNVDVQVLRVVDEILLNKQYTDENVDFLVNEKVNVHF
jgi:hypothetical protein